jgi:hypothetical protein
MAPANLGALDVTQLARLDQASRIDQGFPHDFLGEDFIRDLTTVDAGPDRRPSPHRLMGPVSGVTASLGPGAPPRGRSTGRCRCGS